MGEKQSINTGVPRSVNDMEAQRTMAQSGHVETEGDLLYYEVRGEGQPLLMIPGGGGDGGSYSLVADILSDEFKVITYDRRANARSTMNDPQNFEISQQSRDAVAVLRELGEPRALVFGNSSGAVIALDLAKTDPESVVAVVAHEPPLARVHPQVRKWQRFFAAVYWTAFQFGAIAAMVRFAFGIGVDFSFSQTFKAARAAKKAREKSHEPYLGQRIVTDFFLKQELLPVTNYLPDVELIKRNNVRVFMAAGKRSLAKKRFYAETARILADRLGCEMVTFPGHHDSLFDKPDEFAATLRSVLRRASPRISVKK
jgi:pimeloyl-ACP methyl ester carboxylesterase